MNYFLLIYFAKKIIIYQTLKIAIKLLFLYNN
jgi:hypothetical protein